MRGRPTPAGRAAGGAGTAAAAGPDHRALSGGRPAARAAHRGAGQDLRRSGRRGPQGRAAQPFPAGLRRCGGARRPGLHFPARALWRPARAGGDQPSRTPSSRRHRHPRRRSMPGRRSTRPCAVGCWRWERACPWPAPPWPRWWASALRRLPGFMRLSGSQRALNSERPASAPGRTSWAAGGAGLAVAVLAAERSAEAEDEIGGAFDELAVIAQALAECGSRS